MNYTISKAKIEDAERFGYIQVESWRAAFSDILEKDIISKYLDLEHVTGIYKRNIEIGRGNGLIMQVDGRDHCIAYWDKARNTEDDKMAELICIHSLPERWRNGYGTEMMKQVIKDVKTAGYTSLCLWVFDKNQRARNFYEAVGFIDTGKRQEALGAVEDCYLLQVLE
ncbi:MAG: GNAT family N-acetyltransferase [Lachnospiraceae bacterium]|nr:GNAT family N-acetyltransferase [Lachnospiraceae bacterium]